MSLILKKDIVQIISYWFLTQAPKKSQCLRADLNKKLLQPQHESLYPIGLKSARIEIPHIGTHYIDFSKTGFY